MTDEAGQPTEEELRAAYEAEVRKIRIEQIVLENIVTLVNMGMRRTGLIPGTEDERDPAQVQVAIEGVRAHLPLVEQIAPDQYQPIQDALSQLQMAFVQLGGSAAGSAAVRPGTASDGAPSSPASASPLQPDPQSVTAPPPAEPDSTEPGAPGPAQKSGRLWVPGQ